MAENSAISWTDDTFNPWEGCQKVGPGCDGCYAEARNQRYAPVGATSAPNWGPGAPRRRTSEANWRQPLKWEREQAALVRAWHAPEGDPRGGIGTPYPYARFVFCASLADVFDNAVPAEWRRDLFDLIRATPHLTWLLLTKRPGNILKLWSDIAGLSPWPRNAAIGCTVVNQEEADRDIPKLLDAARSLKPTFTFLSMEPLLGHVDLAGLSCMAFADAPGHPRIDWVITGGETDQGRHKARPAHPDWFRAIRDQCAAAGVPYHHKQNGEWGHCPERSVVPDHLFKIGKKAAGRLLDGVEHNERPEVRA